MSKKNEMRKITQKELNEWRRKKMEKQVRETEALRSLLLRFEESEATKK
jgi:ferredoxin-fold anticodon binding domain-containing protein